MLPGNNQGFLQQKITMTNTAMAQVEMAPNVEAKETY
jgi:hypothetical protein